MAQSTQPATDFSPISSATERSKNFQVAICSALLILILVAVAAVYFIRNRPKSYQPNSVNTTTSIYFVDPQAAKATLGLRNPTANPNSKFVYMILNDAELKALLLHKSVAAKPLGTQDRRIVMWPSQATGQSFSGIETVKESTDPRVAPVKAVTTGGLSGFLGTRLEEGQPMLRVEMSNMLLKSYPQDKRLDEKVLYEDKLSAGHLVFLGEVDDETYEVIVIDAK